jgi:hypothetical protein
MINPATASCFKINSNSPTEHFVVEYRRHISERFGGNTMVNRNYQNNGLLVYRVVPSVNGNYYSAPNGNAGTPYEVYVYRPNGTITANGFILYAAYSNAYQQLNSVPA